MRHGFVFLLLLSLASLPLSAQETLPIYQQYLLGGKFLINPAYYGVSNDININGNYQKQFTDFADSPNVQSIGMHANIVDRLGAGISFFHDQNGPISANGISVGAAYFIPLGDERTRENQFSFGAAANFYNMHVDYEKLAPGDPLLNGQNSTFIAYANLGMQVSYQHFFAGFSAVDIPLSNTRPIVNGIEPAPTKFLILAGYEWMLGESFAIEPSTLVNLSTNNAKMIDLNMLAKVFSATSTFGAGLSFRLYRDYKSRQQTSLSPIITAKINRLTFGAAYNFGLSEISNYGGNSFMLSLGYNFENFINPRGFRYR